MQLNFHLAVAAASSLVWGGDEYKSQIMDSRKQAARLPWGGGGSRKSSSRDTRDEASRGWSRRGGKIISEEHSGALILLQEARTTAARHREESSRPRRRGAGVQVGKKNNRQRQRDGCSVCHHVIPALLGCCTGGRGCVQTTHLSKTDFPLVALHPSRISSIYCFFLFTGPKLEPLCTRSHFFL